MFDGNSVTQLIGNPALVACAPSQSNAGTPPTGPLDLTLTRRRIGHVSRAFGRCVRVRHRTHPRKCNAWPARTPSGGTSPSLSTVVYSVSKRCHMSASIHDLCKRSHAIRLEREILRSRRVAVRSLGLACRRLRLLVRGTPVAACAGGAGRSRGPVLRLHLS